MSLFIEELSTQELVASAELERATNDGDDLSADVARQRLNQLWALRGSAEPLSV